jgi:hypothetical protein
MLSTLAHIEDPDIVSNYYEVFQKRVVIAWLPENAAPICAAYFS